MACRLFIANEVIIALENIIFYSSIVGSYFIIFALYNRQNFNIFLCFYFFLIPIAMLHVLTSVFVLILLQGDNYQVRKKKKRFSFFGWVYGISN